MTRPVALDFQATKEPFHGGRSDVRQGTFIERQRIINTPARAIADILTAIRQLLTPPTPGRCGIGLTAVPDLKSRMRSPAGSVECSASTLDDRLSTIEGAAGRAATRCAGGGHRFNQPSSDEAGRIESQWRRASRTHRRTACPLGRILDLPSKQAKGNPMSKGMDQKRDTKKKPAKTFSEKRAAKREKRQARGR